MPRTESTYEDTKFRRKWDMSCEELAAIIDYSDSYVYKQNKSKKGQARLEKLLLQAGHVITNKK